MPKRPPVFSPTEQVQALRAIAALTQSEVAALLGWTVETLRKKRGRLEAAGFPRRFPGQRRGRAYSSTLVFAWLDTGGLPPLLPAAPGLPAELATDDAAGAARRRQAAEALAQRS